MSRQTAYFVSSFGHAESTLLKICFLFARKKRGKKKSDELSQSNLLRECVFGPGCARQRKGRKREMQKERKREYKEGTAPGEKEKRGYTKKIKIDTRTFSRPGRGSQPCHVNASRIDTYQGCDTYQSTHREAGRGRGGLFFLSFFSSLSRERFRFEHIGSSPALSKKKEKSRERLDGDLPSDA